MIKRIILASILAVLSSLYITARADSSLKFDQSSIITKIIANENDEKTRDELLNIINYIDSTYGNIYDQLSSGEKITIYFGPAHGKDHTEEWRGITTNRVGITGLPEEYYSRLYSRKLYNKFKSNRFIKVVAKPEYQQVLDGNSDSYHYMPFNEVMREAKNANAFMVIEMHMNNVAIFSKADGLVNMPGIHMARDRQGRKMLINIVSTNSGFLTLYNKYDSSGFSRMYAVNIRQSLVKKGYVPNGWDYGAVADDRFTYYFNFPISVIYECGFISDPVEEPKLLNEEYMDGMVQSQYDMLMKTFNDMFGIDITGDELKITKKDFSENIELLKLARIAIFYILRADTGQANIAVNAMKKNYYYGSHKGVIDYYSSIMRRINSAESLYWKGVKYKNKRKHSKARKYFVYAKNSLRHNEFFSAYKRKYNTAIYGNRTWNSTADSSANDKVNTSSSNGDKAPDNRTTYKPPKESSVIVKKSPVNKPVILIIRKGQSVEKSVKDALAPDEDNLKIICNSIHNYHYYSYKKEKVYSKKKKKKIYRTVKVSRKYEFYEGIYILTLDKKSRVVRAERVSSVYLNPDRYQNQQYLKNSYFADTEREKDY